MRSDARKKAADALAESIRNLEAADACAVGCRALAERDAAVARETALREDARLLAADWEERVETYNELATSRTRGKAYAYSVAATNLRALLTEGGEQA